MVALFGDSQPILQLRQLMAACASSDASVLINGETGSGKEVVCRELHRLSRRSQKPFVAINCAAIPATLLESELFGYRKGAYTGAATDQKGRLEIAHGGTLFLDEIGDMPLDVQAKLLRFLEDRIVEPLGGAGDGMLLDVRVVAATHKDLSQLVQARQFREDLFYRLNVVPLYVPPLRERACELPILCNHFARLNARDTQPISFTEVSLALLGHYEWPGNIRELSNLIVRFSVLYPGKVIDLLKMPAVVLPPGLQATLLEHGERYGGSWEPTAVPAFPLTREERLLDYFRNEAGEQNTSEDTLHSLLQGVMGIQALPSEGIEAKSILERLEKTFITVALRQTSNNNTHSARLLRMERTTFIQKLARHGLNGMEEH
ncbi:MAG: Nitrogen assimilation regulatory protein [Pseudomonadota bacterium]|jgi:sigma-54 specific flagellar transcriptional regulator A